MINLLTDGEQQIQALEQELHIEILPGTEIMKDVGVKHFVHSSTNRDRVLVPQPSADPHDPCTLKLSLDVSRLSLLLENKG